MNRRTFLRGTATGIGLASILSRVSLGQGSGVRVVFRGGKGFINGTWSFDDVGIDALGKLVVAPPGTLQAQEIITIPDRIIAPGFIDILTDNTANPIRTYGIVEKYKVTDGVTTALQMHGGSARIAEHYRTFDALPHYVNYGVSTAVMRVRYASTGLGERKQKVEQCLKEGALGVSHSIEYQPTPYPEVLGYAKLARKFDRPLFLHLRYSSSMQELEGVDEAIRLAQESGARVHISHLHSTGGTFHMEEAISRINKARASGLEITCCVYPYSYWATYLHSTRFDEGWRERYKLDYQDLQLVGTGERLTASSFQKYRALKKLVAVPEGTMPMEKTVDLALRESFCYIGSDGGIEYASNANSHPRGAGCFATAIRHGLDIGLPLETMLQKMTGGPRSLVRTSLRDRGELKTGAYADLVVFNPATINGAATVSNPNQFSRGIDQVWINGKRVYKEGVLEAKPGVAIRFETVS